MVNGKFVLSVSELDEISEKSRILFCYIKQGGVLQVLYDIDSGHVWSEYLTGLSYCHIYPKRTFITIGFLSQYITSDELEDMVLGELERIRMVERRACHVR